MNIGKKLYKWASLIIISVSVFIIVLFFVLLKKTMQINASDQQYTITINKVSTVSIYITGSGVKLVSDDISKSIYQVDENTEFTLTSVNESRLFKNWVIKTEANESTIGDGSTEKKLSLTATQNLNINLKRVDPTINDLGKYIDNSFLLSSEADLLNLDTIFNEKINNNVSNTELLAAYTNFFNSDPTFKETIIDSDSSETPLTEQEKINFINNNNYFERIQNGYYKVEESFTVLKNTFQGIGSKDYPFKGVICGLNNSNSSNAQIFLSINATENSEDLYLGLFKYLDQNAVIRNLIIKNSIGVSMSKTNTNQNVYAGGLAAYIDNSLLLNLNISSTLNIETTNMNIYAGGIAGIMKGGIDDISNVDLVFNNNTWVLTSGIGSNIYGGLVSGYAEDLYINKINIDVSGFSINAKNISENSQEYSQSTNTYLGNLFGYYKNNEIRKIENINIYGDNKEYIHADISSGNNYVGGLIGYLETNKELILGKVEFNLDTQKTTEIIAESFNEDSKANLFVAGLVAYVKGDTFTTNDSFKNGIIDTIVDGKKIESYQYLFNMPLEIIAKQQGIQANSETYGSTIAAGLVAEGYLNINGSDEKRSNILITSGKYPLTINAIQTSMSNHENTVSTDYVSSGNLVNNNRHCLSSLVFGYISPANDTTNFTYQNINIYGNNLTIESSRDIGSRSLGDVNAAGFICYAKGRNFKNIAMYLGEQTAINANSLSYEVGYAGSSNAKYQSNNNNYVSSFISHLIGISTTDGTTEINNIKITGYDFNKQIEVGSSVNIQGIQNTKAINNGSGCANYTNENNVGGVFGCTRGELNINNITLEGNETNKTQIVMQGHRDPNSAFVGGIIGFSKLLNDTSLTKTSQTITNTFVKNVNIYGNATIDKNANYGNPDIYSGGIVGACYADSNGGTISIDNAKIINSEINGNGNERIEVYTGGILGTITWSGAAIIKNAAVYKTKITSSVDASSQISFQRGCAHAGGIVGSYTTASLSIYNSALIESVVSSNCSSNIINNNTDNTNTKSISAAVFASTNTTNSIVENFYTNSIITASDSTETKTYTKEYIYGNINKLDNSYYVKNINSFIDATGNELDFSDKEFTTVNETKTVSELFGFDSTNSSSGSIKLFIQTTTENEKDNFTSNWKSNDTSEIELTVLKENSTTEIEIWINIKENGSSQNSSQYSNQDEIVNDGWFKLGKSHLICGKNSDDFKFTDNSFEQSYLVDDEEYYYNNIVDNKYQFITKTEQIKYLYDIGYVEKDKTTIEYEVNGNKTIFNCNETDINLKSTIQTIKIKFSVINIDLISNKLPPSHYLKWYSIIDNKTEEVTLDENSLSGYGSYIYTSEIYEYDTQNNYLMINYELQFTPNKELVDDAILYAILYTGGTTNTEIKYSNQCLKFNLYANKYELVGGTLASYTPPMNESSVDFGITKDNPYYFQSNTSYKIIPLLRRKNESETIINSELHIQDVEYALNSEDAGTIRSNGELTTSSNENSQIIYEVTITLKEDKTEVITIYFIIVTKYNVSYTAEGASVSGLPFATDASSYNLAIDVSTYCGGFPDSFIIDVDNQKYNLLEENENGELKYQWIYNEDGLQITNFDNNNTSYLLKIPNINNETSEQIINGNIKINISFPVNFTIEFHLQTETFNPKFSETNETIMTYKVKSGLTFKDVFTDKYKQEIDEWTTKANNESFGYLFTGFYLIDDSTSITSYGKNFDEILEQESSIKINTSYVFYARWSFLIELVEAPGTHIVTSFNQDFLYEVNKDEYNNLLNKNVTIPINNNRGFVFTIVKDDNFIGEADVDAYIITGTKENQQITEIAIEKYHENMYLYYIAPEDIKGYLVISTKISNSEVIVGENTASVNDEILPEDGIYTYKYVVNHKKGESYIYNPKNGNNNLIKNRELLLEFFEDSFDYNTNTTSILPRYLEKGTAVEVYYNKIINSNDYTSQTILGKYIVTEDNINKIKLTDFTSYNSNEKAFIEMTFEELLQDYESLSEIYYFVIIPPNGYNKNSYDQNERLYGEYVNYHLYVGYVDENDNYLSGIRSHNTFTNIPIEDVLYEKLELEDACQKTTYTITPSRTTMLERENDDTNSLYHFVDDKKFSVFNINVFNGELTENNRIRFFDKSEKNDTIIKSNEIKNGIEKLILNFGYNKGTIKISASSDDISYETVEIITITSEMYIDYVIAFNISKGYKYFKIEKTSNQEIRLAKIGLMIINSPKLYELEFANFELEDIYIPNFSNQNIDLPIKNGLTWSVSSQEVSIENNVLMIDKVTTPQTITLKARYETVNTVITRTFKIIIQNTMTTDLFNEIILPIKTTSSILLPNVTGLNWTINSGSAIIENNVLTLTSEKDEITLTASYNNMSKTFKIKMEKNLSIYTLRENIIGDTRHEGKRFVMAIQIKDQTGNIVTNINNITLLINGIEYEPLIKGENLNVLYFDLSTILEKVGGDNFDIKINGLEQNYSISAVQLIECSLNAKPAMGEIRTSYTF